MKSYDLLTTGRASNLFGKRLFTQQNIPRTDESKSNGQDENLGNSSELSSTTDTNISKRALLSDLSNQVAELRLKLEQSEKKRLLESEAYERKLKELSDKHSEQGAQWSTDQQQLAQNIKENRKFVEKSIEEALKYTARAHLEQADLTATFYAEEEGISELQKANVLKGLQKEVLTEAFEVAENIGLSSVAQDFRGLANNIQEVEVSGDIVDSEDSV